MTDKTDVVTTQIRELWDAIVPPYEVLLTRCKDTPVAHSALGFETLLANLKRADRGVQTSRGPGQASASPRAPYDVRVASDTGSAEFLTRADNYAPEFIPSSWEPDRDELLEGRKALTDQQLQDFFASPELLSAVLDVPRDGFNTPPHPLVQKVLTCFARERGWRALEPLILIAANLDRALSLVRKLGISTDVELGAVRAEILAPAGPTAISPTTPTAVTPFSAGTPPIASTSSSNGIPEPGQ